MVIVVVVKLLLLLFYIDVKIVMIIQMLKIYKNLVKNVNFNIFAHNTNKANITNITNSKDNYGRNYIKYNK